MSAGADVWRVAESRGSGLHQEHALAVCEQSHDLGRHDCASARNDEYFAHSLDLNLQGVLVTVTCEVVPDAASSPVSYLRVDLAWLDRADRCYACHPCVTPVLNPMHLRSFCNHAEPADASPLGDRTARLEPCARAALRPAADGQVRPCGPCPPGVAGPRAGGQ